MAHGWIDFEWARLEQKAGLLKAVEGGGEIGGETCGRASVVEHLQHTDSEETVEEGATEEKTQRATTSSRCLVRTRRSQNFP